MVVWTERDDVTLRVGSALGKRDYVMGLKKDSSIGHEEPGLAAPLALTSRPRKNALSHLGTSHEGMPRYGMSFRWLS